MSQDVFEIRPLAPVSFFQKLFRQFPEQNAVIELNNQLASMPLLDISGRDVDELDKRYWLNVRTEFQLNMEEFYAVYLNHCLHDKGLGVQQTKELSHLGNILRLDDATIAKLRIKIGEQFYTMVMREAVSKGSLTEADTATLSNLESTLELPAEMAMEISSRLKQEVIENYFSQITASGDLSPDGEHTLENVAVNLGVDLRKGLSNAARERLGRLKLYWSLENNELRVIHPDIHIRSQELCYLSIAGVRRFESRDSSRSPDFCGHFTVLRTAKLLFAGNESMNLQSNDRRVMKPMDTGTIYLTNQRIFFAGSEKTTTITLEKITDIKPYSDGLEILKNAGKHQVFQLPELADVFCIQLERLLREKKG